MDLKKLDAIIDSYKDEIISDIQKWVAIPSVLGEPAENAPFGIEGRKVPALDPSLCRNCKTCAVETRCPMKAAKVQDGKLVIDRSVCINCGVCVGKCPFGAVAAESETRYQIFLGGTWGKHTRMGTPVSRLVGEDEVLPILEKSILWFKENGQPKERFGKAIDRIGVEKAEAEILGDEILARKAEILAK